MYMLFFLYAGWTKYLLCVLYCSTGTAGAAFATASCLSANIREKDDYVNASIGGALAGSIFGVACKGII